MENKGERLDMNKRTEKEELAVGVEQGVEAEQKTEPEREEQAVDMQQKMAEALEQPAQPVVSQMKPMKKKCNVPALILGVVAVLGVGAGAYFGVQYFGEKERADKLAQQSVNVATFEDVVEVPDEESGDEMVANKMSYGFDVNLIDRPKDAEYYMLFDNFGGVCVSTKYDDQSTLVVETYGDAREVYNLPSLQMFRKDIKLDKNINDLIIGEFGQAVGVDEVILMIMEDGSVGYLPVYSMLKSDKYEVKTINGISGAVKFYKTNLDGVYTMIQTADGKIYNLWYILEEMGVVG